MNPVFPILAAAGAALYLLYRQGLAVTKSIAAILFVFCPGREGDRVNLDSCTGWVRHVARFHGGKTYMFALDYQISKGSAEVLLLNKKKQLLLKLDGQSPNGMIKLEKDGRYYLRWEFRNATGQCELRWNETAA